MNLFHFKQFTIHQDRCAMKIGTDGVLLGAWASLEHDPESILDIGTGTGVIALMLAQRATAKTIDALEIDENAYEQCVENFECSPWADILFCYHAAFDEFVNEVDDVYDLIVSNPPFFASPLEDAAIGGGNPTMDDARKKARFHEALPFGELLYGVSKFLGKNGVFATIIPFAEEEKFISLAARKGLFPKKITHVKGNPSSEIKRSLLEFRFAKSDVAIDTLTIEVARHEYTPEYIALTKDFYLKM